MKKLQRVTVLFLLLLNCVVSCKDSDVNEIKNSYPPAAPKDTAAAEGAAFNADETSAYMSMADWEKAKAALAVIESIIQIEMNKFTAAYSRVIEARRYDNFDAALEHAKALDPSLDAIERSVAAITLVSNYPEFDTLKQNLSAMMPLLRSFSLKLVKSVELAKQGDRISEAALVKEYCDDYAKAMEYFRTVYEIYGEILTRGARTDSQKLTGAKQGGAVVEKKFRAGEKEIAAQFDGIINNEYPLVESLARKRKFDESDAQAQAVYTSIQNLVMRINTLDPGNEKSLWDARQLLLTSMSWHMMALQKYREYLAQLKANDSQIEQTEKIYKVLKVSAEDEWKKYRRQRM